jgi:photosystem II stability/assembly factor-like uncharacterized protein
MRRQLPIPASPPGPAELAAEGRAWERPGTTTGDVNAVAIDPADSNTVYAGTGVAGLFRSADGGRHWQFAGLGGTISLLSVEAVTRAVYAVAGNSLWKSADGARSWRSLAPGLRAAGVAPAVRDLALTAAPGTLYVLAPALREAGAAPAAPVICKSVDAGAVWRVACALPAADLPAGELTSGAPAAGVAGRAPSRLIAHPAEPDTLWVLTAAGEVFATIDGAASWSACGLLDARITALAAGVGKGATVLYAIGGASSQAIDRVTSTGQAIASAAIPGQVIGPAASLSLSDDRGRTWSRLRCAFGAPPRRIFADAAAPGAFVAVDAAGGFHRITGAGQRWRSQSGLPRGLRDVPQAVALDLRHPGAAFATVAGGRLGVSLYKRERHSSGWVPAMHGMVAGDLESVLCQAGDPPTLWACAGPAAGGAVESVRGGHGHSGVGSSSDNATAAPRGVWKSIDRGTTWENCGAALGPVTSLALLTGGVFAGTRTGLWRSDDGGSSFQPAALAGVPVEALASPPDEPATLFALAGHGQAASVWRSLDGGQTWAGERLKASVLALVPGTSATLYANASMARAPRHGLVDCVRRSADRGRTWTTLLRCDGLVRAIAVDPADRRRILVAVESLDRQANVLGDFDSHGTLFLSTDGGRSWSQAAVAPSRPAVWALLADPLAPHAFLAAGAGGVFASADGGATWTAMGEGHSDAAVLSLAATPGSPAALFAATRGCGVCWLARP